MPRLKKRWLTPFVFALAVPGLATTQSVCPGQCECTAATTLTVVQVPVNLTATDLSLTGNGCCESVPVCPTFSCEVRVRIEFSGGGPGSPRFKIQDVCDDQPLGTWQLQQAGMGFVFVHDQVLECGDECDFMVQEKHNGWPVYWILKTLCADCQD